MFVIVCLYNVRVCVHAELSCNLCITLRGYIWSLIQNWRWVINTQEQTGWPHAKQSRLSLNSRTRPARAFQNRDSSVHWLTVIIIILSNLASPLKLLMDVAQAKLAARYKPNARYSELHRQWRPLWGSAATANDAGTPPRLWLQSVHQSEAQWAPTVFHSRWVWGRPPARRTSPPPRLGWPAWKKGKTQPLLIFIAPGFGWGLEPVVFTGAQGSARK